MITDSKGKIISAPEAGDDICVQATVVNGKAKDKPIIMFAAKYNNNGYCIGGSMVSDMLKPCEKKTYDLENMKLENNFSKLKVYVWDAETLKPIWEIVQ